MKSRLGPTMQSSISDNQCELLCCVHPPCSDLCYCISGLGGHHDKSFCHSLQYRVAWKHCAAFSYISGNFKELTRLRHLTPLHLGLISGS